MYEDIQSTHAIQRRPMQDGYIGPSPEEDARIDRRHRMWARVGMPLTIALFIVAAVIAVFTAKDRAQNAKQHSTFICTPVQAS